MTDTETGVAQRALEETTHKTVQGVIECPVCVYGGDGDD